MATIFSEKQSVITLQPEGLPQSSKASAEDRHGRTQPVDWNQELQWFQNNRWVFEKYKGEWVAIKGDSLVAHDRDYQTLQQFCREHKFQHPFLQYIPNADSEWDLGASNYAVPAHFGNNS